jgi:molybdopterin/thiamine biosynthesis adenylyltransferase
MNRICRGRFSTHDVGAPKVRAAAARLAALNPAVSLEQHSQRLDAEGLAQAVRRADVVLDGTDNFGSRFAVNKACVDAGVPLVSGAAVRLEGQLVVFSNRPGDPCYRCLYEDEDEWLGDCRGNGVLAPVVGAIGTLMAVEAIKVIVGMPGARHNRLLLWDAKSGDWNAVAIKRDPSCPHCGHRA